MHFGRAHQHGVGEHDEIAADLFDEPGNDDAVEHAIGMIRDDDGGPGRRDAGERCGIVAHVELQLAHGGAEEAFARSGIALVLQVHPLQVRLPGSALDEADQAALDAGIGRRRIAEQVVVHHASITGNIDRAMTEASPSLDARPAPFRQGVELLQLRDQRLELP